MLVKYYLTYNMAPFENFALGLQNAWTGPECKDSILALLH